MSDDQRQRWSTFRHLQVRGRYHRKDLAPGTMVLDGPCSACRTFGVYMSLKQKGMMFVNVFMLLCIYIYIS